MATTSQEVIHLLTSALAAEGSLNILDLEGLGSELWAGRDASEHVARERDTWD